MRYLGRCLIGLAAFRMAVANVSTSPSPAADTDLICPTENAVDCYPRIFQPTEKFQLIRKGQDLPPGLHIRMNVYTGEKEARLNIPMDDDVQQLEGFPTEQSVVVVDRPALNEIDEEPALRDRVPQKPPQYEAAGKIVPPRESEGSDGESGSFHRAIHILDAPHPPEDITSALSDLSNLAHDIYYGVELTKSSTTLHNLVRFMFSDSVSWRRQAASVLGVSIQNNPTALSEAQNSWNTLAKSSHETLISTLQLALASEDDPSATRAKISFLYGLTKSPEMRDAFVENKGMDLLLSIFKRENKEWDIVRTKIMHYVSDTFLDEDMGAEVGIWPTRSVEDWHEGADENKCDMTDGTREPCWEWYLETLAAEGGEEMEGVRQFLKLLRDRRPSSSSSHVRQGVLPTHEEL